MTYTAKLIDRLVAAQMTLATSNMLTAGNLDAAKLKTCGFVSCNCKVFLKDLWCEHVLVHAMVRKIVLRVPPRFDSRSIGPVANGRNAAAIRGGALGYH